MDTPTLTIRIPLNLKRVIARLAKKDDRSVTSFVVKALRVAVENEVRAPLSSLAKTKGRIR